MNNSEIFPSKKISEEEKERQFSMGVTAVVVLGIIFAAGWIMSSAANVKPAVERVQLQLRTFHPIVGRR